MNTSNGYCLINLVYEHLQQHQIQSLHRGNVTVLITPLPILGCDLYVYLNAYSFKGRQPGLNILLLFEPITVLPGQYDDQIWRHFDYVYTHYDKVIERDPDKFKKVLLTRSGFIEDDIPTTENGRERIEKYPLKNRLNAVCMINGNKTSRVPGEGYSKRVEAALWFHLYSDIVFDVFGNPPFSLPNYKRVLERNEKFSTLAKYKYGLCFENVIHPEYSIGYVDKIFDCLETRTVPIYWGAPDIEKYVPKGCFIDFRKCKSYRELDDFLHSVNDKTYQNYICNIDQWVSHGGGRPYSMYAIYNKLTDLLAGTNEKKTPDLFNGSVEWAAGAALPLAGRRCINAPVTPHWSFHGLSIARSPLIDYTTNNIIYSQSTDTHIQKINQLKKMKKHSEAAKAYETILSEELFNADILYQYAQLLIEMSWHKESLVRLQQVIMLNPGHSLALNDIGLLYTLKKDYKQAVQYLHASIRADSQNYSALENLLSLLLNLGSNEYVLKFTQSLLAQSPADARLRDILKKFNLPMSRMDSRPVIFTLKNIKSPNHSLTAEFLNKLAQIFHPDVFVETGTFLGGTTLEASRIFKAVHTIELSEELYRKAQAGFAGRENIHAYQGDSGELFPKLLTGIEGKILFWLDGHYSEGVTVKSEKNTPILEELLAIKDANVTDSVILIDDLRIFPNSWTRRPDIASLKDYPTIPQLLRAIKDINDDYVFVVAGDVLIAYPSSEKVSVSPVVAACTISRLVDEHDVDVKKVIDAERIISTATGVELSTIRDLYAQSAHPEMAGLGEHFRLWNALTLLAGHQNSQAYEAMMGLAANGFTHWRIRWYLAQSAYAAGNLSFAYEVIQEVLQLMPEFTDAQNLLKSLEIKKRIFYDGKTILTHLRQTGLWNENQPLRLHLGCGEKHFDEYVNIDYPPSKHSVQTRPAADFFTDITLLDFPDASIDEIRLHHVFEHFSRPKALALLIRWHEWLKVGGKLHIETPDIAGCSRALAADMPYKTKQAVLRHAFGSQEASWAYHLDGWYKEKFEHILPLLGFTVTCQNVQWNVEPWLANVHALAVKQRTIGREELLRQADIILAESMVADVPQERLMSSVWSQMMRTELEQQQESACSSSSAVASCYATVAVVFSKDRAMQLDCALRSFFLHCTDPDLVQLNVLYKASSPEHESQYRSLKGAYPTVHFVPETDFKQNVLSLLSAFKYILFLVDDNIFVRSFRLEYMKDGLDRNATALGFSLRLGTNTTYSYMLDRNQTVPPFDQLDNSTIKFDWTKAELDFAYPLELSSSLYRTEDIMPLLKKIEFTNPNVLELQLDTNKFIFAQEKSFLLSLEQSVTFCNPVNTVQTMWVNRAGKKSSYSAQKLSELFGQGNRINAGRFSGFVPNSCHQEVAFDFIREYILGDGQSQDIEWQSPLVTIGIANYNGIQHIQACLESIRRNTPEPHEVIVVDNGSTDGSREYLREQPDIILVENPENVGAPGARNQFLSIAKGDYVVFLDNDTLVTKNWIKNFITHMESDPQIGIIGACTNYASGLQGIAGVTYKTIEELEVYAEKRAQDHRGELLPSPKLISFCVFIRRAAIEKIGAMETGFSKFCFEDDDYAMRIHIAGLKSVVAHDVFIHHTGGPQGRGDNQYNKWLSDAWEGFKRKWGLAPNLPYGSSYDVGALVSQPFNPKRHYLPLPDPASVFKLVHHTPRGRMLPATGHLSEETEAQNGFEDVYKKERSPGVKTVAPEGSKEAKISMGKDITCSKIPFKKESTPDMVSIIMPVTGHSKQLKKCIENIRKFTSETHEIIFVENGCKAGILKWIRQTVKRKSNCKLIKAGKEAGRGECFNMGMETSSGEYIVLLYKHVMVADGWLNGMLRCVNRADDVGIVGPMTNGKAAGIQCVSDSAHVKIDQLEEYAGAFLERNRHRRVPSREIASFCMLFRRGLVAHIGPFDEELEQGSESDDYCLRAALEGYKNLIAGDVFVLCGDFPPQGNKRFFDYKWRDIDAKSHDGVRLGVINAITDAEKLYQREEVDKAIVKAIDGIKYRPEEEAIYHCLAEMLIDCERFGEGIDAINSIPEDKRDSARTFELTGWCKAGLELYDEAAQCADRALSLNGSSAPALNLKGVLAHGRGDKSDSEDFFKKAIASDPGYGDAYTNLGVLAWEAGRKEEALEILEKGFILSPTAEDSRTAYLSAISEIAAFERAEGVFREAKTLYPESRRIAFLLIDILIRQEKYDSAIQDIRKAMITFGINDGILSAAQAVLDRFDAQETKDVEKKPTLSLCMIVKDEENCLARCLMSAIPVVDDIVIVDTGSTDRTKAIAKTFGARVYDFEWTDDFSEARNFSLSKATGNWILVLDADETISALDYDRLTKIVKNNPDHPAAYSITTRNYVKPPYVIGWTCNNGKYADEEEGTGWYPSLKVRLFPNNSHIRFVNPVHEFVEASLKENGIEIIKSDIPVHHYGQLDREYYVAKGEKYYLLGKKKLEEKGEDLKALTELAIQAGGEFGKYEEAVGLWKRVLKIDPRNTKALVNMGGALLKLEKYEAARTSSKMAMALAPDLKEAVIIYTTCEVLIGDAGKAIPLLEDLLKEVPEYPLAFAILAAAYGIEGERKKGLEQIRNISKMGFKSADYLHDLSERLISTGKTDRAVSLLEFAVESGKGTREIRELLDGLLIG